MYFFKYLCIYLFIYFWLLWIFVVVHRLLSSCAASVQLHKAGGILGPQPGIEPASPGIGTQILDHWTTREVLVSMYCCINNTYSLAETRSVKKTKMYCS